MHGFALVIFDCDGVLVDSEVLSCQCLADVLSQHGLPTTIDEVFDRFLGRSFDAVEAHYRRGAGEAPAAGVSRRPLPPPRSDRSGPR